MQGVKVNKHNDRKRAYESTTSIQAFKYDHVSSVAYKNTFMYTNCTTLVLQKHKHC